jgi:hypothetical protein
MGLITVVLETRVFFIRPNQPRQLKSSLQLSLKISFQTPFDFKQVIFQLSAHMLQEVLRALTILNLIVHDAKPRLQLSDLPFLKRCVLIDPFP